MDFSGLIGQKKIIRKLMESIKKGTVGHAYIFYGPDGIGKRTIARAFAGLLLCNNPLNEGSNACNKCISCKLSNSGSNPDLMVIEDDGTKIGVDEIRRMQSDVNKRPTYSQRKVYLILKAEKMTEQAQNCLLKTIEEPPSYCIIVLTVTNPSKLLSTVISRVYSLMLERYSTEEIYDFLVEKKGIDNIKAEFLTRYSDGIIGKALDLAFDENLHSIREKVFEILILLNKKPLQYIYETVVFFKDNKEHLDFIFDMMSLYFRDIISFIHYQNEKRLINIDKKDIIINNMSLFTTLKALNAIEIIDKTRTGIKKYANFQLSIEIMLMKLSGGL